MKKLAEKTYWDSIYQHLDEKKTSSSFLSVVKTKLKHWTRDYSNYLMWEVVLPTYLPTNSQYKVIEVGCAPGKYLVNLHKTYGYQPYGVEYSEKGAQVTRALFAQHHLPPEHVIETDFFDDTFLDAHKGKYDVVFSRGFIEHYDDVASVVQRHIDLIAPGGFIILSIPNLSGINGLLGQILNIDSYRLHNTSIMNKKDFTDLFKDTTTTLYSDYVGIFSWGLFNTNSHIKYLMYRIMLILQRPLDCVLRILIKKNWLRCHYTSPYLLYVGQKKA